MNSYKTPLGELKVKVFGHASLLFQINGKNIYVDPYSEVTDYTGMDEADLILSTHDHYDHYDPKAFNEILATDTAFIVSESIGKVDHRYIPLANGDSCEWDGIKIYALPAYNIERRNEDGNHFHPKGFGNGYLFDFGGYKVYVAGDTEPIEEMKELQKLDIAFLPKNLPYTMTDDEFVGLANQLKPAVLYPIHYFEIDYPALSARLDKDIIFIDPNKA